LTEQVAGFDVEVGVDGMAVGVGMNGGVGEDLVVVVVVVVVVDGDVQRVVGHVALPGSCLYSGVGCG
jgi:hypothetical protein